MENVTLFIMQKGNCGEEYGGTAAGPEVSRLQLYRRSGDQARYRAESPGPVQGASARNHAAGQGRQHRNDNGVAGSVYAGLAQLFRILRNAVGAGGTDSLGRAAMWLNWQTPRRTRATLLELGVLQ